MGQLKVGLLMVLEGGCRWVSIARVGGVVQRLNQGLADLGLVAAAPGCGLAWSVLYNRCQPHRSFWPSRTLHHGPWARIHGVEVAVWPRLDL